MYNKKPTTYWESLPTLEPPKSSSTPRSSYDPVEAEQEALTILQRANDEAAAILASAKQISSDIVAQAKQDASGIEKTAKVQGAAEGYAEAREQVQSELSAAWDDRIEKLRSDVQTVIDGIADQRKTLWDQTEQDVLAFVIEMAKRVVKVEIQQNNKVIGEMIRHALRRVADKDNIRIRVAPEELMAIRADRKDLLLVLDGARQLEIVDDRRIGRGGCVIETSAGTIDARIETQFEQISDKLGVLPLAGEAPE